MPGMTRIERAGLAWRKSSYSNSSANCVQIAFNDLRVAARDSKHPAGPTLDWPAAAWTTFLATR
jgi:Domain of unknown function (DUF397)